MSKTNRFKVIRVLTIITSFLLAVNLISAFFLVRSSIYPSLAEEQLLCLKICEQGVGDCDFGTCANLPAVTTQAVTDITQTTATGNGTVVSDGGDTITERGTVMATSINPTTSDTKHTATGTTGAFITSITGLSANTTYYVRAYAINGVGTNYGGNVTFTTLTEEEEPEEEAEQPSGGGSGPAPLAPKQLSNYLIPEVGPTPAGQAYIDVSFLVDVESTLSPIKNTDGVQNIAGTYTTFRGKTNIKDARIVLKLTSLVYYGTTYADSQGNWKWTVPEPLELGYHELTVQAFSPYYASLNTSQIYKINITALEALPEVIPPEPSPEPSQEEPVPSGEPTPPTSGVPLPPDAVKDLYALNLKVIIPEDGMTPTNQLDVQTEITSFDPTTKEAFTLTYTIYDSNRARIYVQKKEIVVQDQISDLSRLVTSLILSPGDYLVTVELVNKHGQAFVATDSFTIEPHKFTVTPFLTLTTEETQLVLLWSSVTLYLLLLLLIYLLYREYQKVRLALYQVTEKDLFDSGMIS